VDPALLLDNDQYFFSSWKVYTLHFLYCILIIAMNCLLHFCLLWDTGFPYYNLYILMDASCICIGRWQLW
jgi:hypothetical protein